MAKLKLQKVIETRLNQTKEGCKFKKAWLPKGWACVHIKTFSKDLAKVIKKKEKN